MKNPTWVSGRHEYEWLEVTSCRWIFFGEEETHWVLRWKHSGSERLRCTPDEYRSMLKRQKSEPCKLKSNASYPVERGAAVLDRPFDLYWYRDAFYDVSAEVKDDEIAGFIEDHEEQLKEQSRERESRKAKELANVRDRIRGKSKSKPKAAEIPEAKTKTNFLPPPKEGWTVESYAEARGISEQTAWHELRAASAEGKVIEQRRNGFIHYPASD